MAEKGGFENYEICVYATHKAARTIMECSITQMSKNRQSAAAENSRPGVEKAPCLLNKRNRMPLADILFFYLAEKGGFEPPVPLRVRQFSKLLVSATHPSLLRRKWLALPLLRHRNATLVSRRFGSSFQKRLQKYC